MGNPSTILFKNEELAFVKTIYRNILDSTQSGMNIKFYCQEDHIVWDPSTASWVDIDYTYLVNGQKMRMEYNMHVGNPTQKPGVQGTGASYTTLGNVLFPSLWRACLTMSALRVQNVIAQ